MSGGIALDGCGEAEDDALEVKRPTRVARLHHVQPQQDPICPPKAVVSASLHIIVRVPALEETNKSSARGESRKNI